MSRPASSDQRLNDLNTPRDKSLSLSAVRFDSRFLVTDGRRLKVKASPISVALETCL